MIQTLDLWQFAIQAYGFPVAGTAMTGDPTTAALLLRVHGRVQGVGFRPFVYRLAHCLALTGWVRNRSGAVDILVQGEPADLSRFQRDLIEHAPPLARPQLVSAQTVTCEPLAEFRIDASAAADRPDVHTPPDCFTCNDCLAELRDPGDRRHRYPFINCTQCGPRYTIIRALPYDRPNTTLAEFALCPACRAEYDDPLDRRFHAQPLACPDCGPQVEFQHADSHEKVYGEAALSACLAALRGGQIVAVKGVGGYHLLCAATSAEAVARLRARKHRPDKPLAVMFPQRGDDGLEVVRTAVRLDAASAALLNDPMRPIVLVPLLPAAKLAPNLAPGLRELGVFLPYSPLHHLLLDDFNGPLVATSGNLSGEPVITDNAEASARLANIADAFLHHDRPIERPADDPVYRSSAGQIRPLRLGRGNAPLELTLPESLDEPLLAVGGHMKTTIALGWDKRVVISPHIGELDSPRALAVFEQVCHDLQRLYGIQAQRLVCDAHPGYASTRWAARQTLPLLRVLHHHAHASALAGEYPDIEYWLTFTWDGVGYGADGSLWGGEALWGCPGDWRQVAGLRRFRLPGGERAGREPWRSAAALCWEAGLKQDKNCFEGMDIVHQAWKRNLNSPVSSAAGRVCDAAAALILGLHETSFEGQGPMLLEALAEDCGDCNDWIELPLLVDDNDILRADWLALLPVLADKTQPAAQRAAIFYNSLAETIVAQALTLGERYTFDGVGLSGGVFQNRWLCERVVTKLTTAGIPVCLHEQIPCNDGGLSFGQIIEAAAVL